MNYGVKTNFPHNEKIDSINIDNVIDYLFLKKLIDNKSIVNGDLEIFDVSRKNRNIKIANRLGSDLFLKQANQHDNISIITIKRESLLYAILQTEIEFTSMVDIAPKILDYDEKNNIMITEYVHGNSWLQYITRAPNMKLEKDVVTSLGNTIGTFHRNYEKVSTRKILQFLPRIITFENLLIHPGPDIFINLSQANLKLLKIIQRDPKIYDALDELFAHWSSMTLIHGDIKFDNIIVTNEKDTRKSIITDWEMANIGDPAWDVGSIFQEFIRSWLYALRITGTEDAQELLDMSTESLQNMQYALRVFWNAYIQVIQKNPKETNDLLIKSCKFCAARLFQSAYEMLQSQSELNNTTVYMAQLGLNMMTNVSNATIHLLGIPFKLEL